MLVDLLEKTIANKSKMKVLRRSIGRQKVFISSYDNNEEIRDRHQLSKLLEAFNTNLNYNTKKNAPLETKKN